MWQGLWNRNMAKIVVIGGGISGVSCVQILSQECSSHSILLISSSALLKMATNIEYYGRAVSMDVDTVSADSDAIQSSLGQASVTIDTINRVNLVDKVVYGVSGYSYSYDKLVICTGARPKMISDQLNISSEAKKYIIGLRDTNTVAKLKDRIQKSRRVLIVGNGGIALELVYDIEFCQVIWSIKDDFIGSTFFGPGAAKFVSNKLLEKRQQSRYTKRLKYTAGAASDDTLGTSVGPDWDEKKEIHGLFNSLKDVTIERSTVVDGVNTREELASSMSSVDDDNDWPVFVKLSNGKIYGCDCIISATGVIPNTEFLDLNKAPDGGILVNRTMQSSNSDVYASGDCCSIDIQEDLWFQMRLWSQANQQGVYAGYCVSCAINGTSPEIYYPFTLFTHVTTLFGYKVILLGRFADRAHGNELLVRVRENQDYVEYVIRDDTIIGATLIGETDLEEAIQHLLLSAIKVTEFKNELLEPTLDLEDYFD